MFGGQDLRIASLLHACYEDRLDSVSPAAHGARGRFRMRAAGAVIHRLHALPLL